MTNEELYQMFYGLDDGQLSLEEMPVEERKQIYIALGEVADKIFATLTDAEALAFEKEITGCDYPYGGGMQAAPQPSMREAD